MGYAIYFRVRDAVEYKLLRAYLLVLLQVYSTQFHRLRQTLCAMAFSRHLKRELMMIIKLAKLCEKFNCGILIPIRCGGQLVTRPSK